jgi:hypothetical protein
MLCVKTHQKDVALRISSNQAFEFQATKLFMSTGG